LSAYALHSAARGFDVALRRHQRAIPIPVSSIVQETITAAMALLRSDPWKAIPDPKICDCGLAFVLLTREGILSPEPDDLCMLCRGREVADADSIPIDHANILIWQADKQALARFAERMANETGMDVLEVTAELAEWETFPGFQERLHTIAPSAPTRQSAWDAAMRVWIQGPEIAALQSPLVGRILGKRKGQGLDVFDVKRLVARVKGMKVFDGPISTNAAQQMLDLIEAHGREILFIFHMKDGTKQQWRGNGTRLR
jgi:hypothetical protein